MQITSKDAPASSPAPSAQVDARARAIAIFEGRAAQSAQAQEHPVANPNAVQPEEMSVITGTSKKEEVQADTSEEPKASESSEKEVKADSKPSEDAPKDSEEAPLSDKFAQLARKEKAMRQKMLEMKAAEDAIKAREAALAEKEARESKAREEKALKDRLASDPLSVLEEMGWSYDKLTEKVLSREAPKPEEAAIAKLQAEIEAIKKGQEEAVKAQQTAQQKQYEHAINTLRNDTKKLVESDPEFETVKATDSIEDVVQLIEKTFNEEGRLLTVEEAARAVEDYLVEEATKLAKLSKIQRKLAPTPSKESAPKSVEGDSDKKQSGMKTLTNAASTPRQLSARERAMLAFKGELK